MKKTAGILLLLATPVFATDLSGYVKMGTSASFGVEGLDLNLDMKDWLGVIKSRPRNGEETPTRVKDLVNTATGIMKMFDIELPPEPQINLLEVSKLAAKGGLFDGYLEAEIDVKKINTRFGASIYGTSTRYGEPFTQFITPERGVIYADTKFEKFEMANSFYFNGHKNGVYGLDRFRYDDSAKKQTFQFDASGNIHAFDLVVRPEFEYALELGSSHQYFTFQPQITYNIVDDKKQKLVLTAGYRLSNHEQYRLAFDEFKDDIIKLAPGLNRVEYFKSWEQCENRDISQGCLDGKQGSVRAVGLPTGTLYGSPLIPYAIAQVKGVIYGELKKIDDLGVEGLNLTNVLNKALKDKQIKLSDLKSLLPKFKDEKVKKHLESVLAQFKNKDAIMDLATPIMADMGIKDKNISSLYLTHMMPEDLEGTLLKVLNGKEGDNAMMLLMSKMVHVVNRHEPSPDSISIIDDLNYALPEEEFGWALDIVTKNQALFEDIEPVLGIMKDKHLKELMGAIDTLKENQAKLDEKYEEKVQECIAKNAKNDWWWSFVKKTPEKMCRDLVQNLGGGTEKFFKGLEDTLQKDEGVMAKIKPVMSKTMVEYKPKITKVLNDLDAVLDTLKNTVPDTSRNPEKIKKAYDSIVKMKGQLNEALDLLVCVEKEGTCKKANFIEGFKKFNTLMKDVMGTLRQEGGLASAYIDPIKTVANDVTGRVLGGVDKILNTPEEVRAFDMFAGMHILGTEYDAHKAAYQKEVLNGMTSTSFDAGKISNGVVVKFDYTYPKKHLQTGIGLDYSYAKYKHRFDTQAYFAYTPSYMDLVAGVDMEYNRVTHPSLSYHKLSVKGQLGLDFKIRTKNKQWLFKPGVGYVGSFEYLGYVAGGAEVEIYDRTSDEHLVRKDGTVVDISTISKYGFNPNEYKKVISKGQSRFLSGEHYFVPRMTTVFMPKKHIILEHRFMMPVKLNGQTLDGFMIRNELSLTIKF